MDPTDDNDDLFADLYGEDEPRKTEQPKPTPAPASTAPQPAPLEKKPEPLVPQAQSAVQKAVDPRQSQGQTALAAPEEPNYDDHTETQAQYSWGAPTQGAPNNQNRGGYEETSHGEGNNGYSGGDHGTGSPAIKEDGCVFTLHLASLCFISWREEGMRVRGKVSRRCPHHGTALQAVAPLAQSGPVARGAIGADYEWRSSTLYTPTDTSIGDLALEEVLRCRCSSNYEYLASTSDTNLAAAQVACIREVTKWQWIFDSGDHSSARYIAAGAFRQPHP
ncbi:hypothetical protein EX30DRAFT_28908 [Ascodesmis nigricans]|uniref:Uncharacterized protein n=1 Tax=Ascodesmis nigricans TaxID=341454 RepID=A0A4S2N8E9_9PEZI|nr:hypothetical protein EX30DRAFT_28908 [Ascodesmis nigricans]